RPQHRCREKACKPTATPPREYRATRSALPPLERRGHCEPRRRAYPLPPSDAPPYRARGKPIAMQVARGIPDPCLREELPMNRPVLRALIAGWFALGSVAAPA